MTDIKIIGPDKLAQFKEIWKSVFCDDESFFKLFFNEFSDTFSGFITYENEIPVGSACVIDVFSLKNGITSLPCPYIYALGVLPEHRSKGIGTQLITACRDHCADKYGISCIVPSEPSLFDYYSRTADFMTSFIADDVYLEREGAVAASLKRITPEYYGQLRETLLADIPHMELSAAGLRFIDGLCKLNYSEDCGLYFLQTDNAYAIAMFDDDDGTMFLREIIASDGNERGFAAAMLWSFDYTAGRYRCPVTNKKHPESTRAFGMLSKQISGGPFYFGPAFD